MPDSAARFLELTRRAVDAPDVPSAVQPILEALVSTTAAVGAAYFQQRDQAFYARASQGEMPGGQAMAEILAHGLPARLPILEVLEQTRQPVFVDDTRAAAVAEAFAGLGVASVAAAPVLDTWGRLRGAFLMHSFEVHEWTEVERRFFQGIADVLAHVASRLVAQEEAAAAREGAIRALGMALELRDGETKGHTDRVTALALDLGKALGLDGADLEALRWGAYLHDIGKIGVPDQILRKPGALTEDEWTEMRRHPGWGRDFGLNLGFLPLASLEVIAYHHERWDGRGYPEGLAGEAIPLGARIFSICDVWDALRSDRPYKPAWPVDRARVEIENSAWTRFDPRLVRVFLDLDPRPT